ncbi:MAG: IS630 family transposase [Candidatus Helarchaeota archaeon]|nr:IS630 family transposase [Candidatus Helarchaeota archaeon]
MEDPNIQVWCEDEVHFGRYSTLIRTWAPKGKQPQVISASTRQHVGFFGVVNVKSGQLMTRESKVFNETNFMSFVRYLLSQVKGRIYLVLDNARWHTSKELKSLMSKHRRKFVCVYLPPYSPKLNPIERVWKMIRSKVTHNRYFASVKELANALMTHFLQLMYPNETLKSLFANI